MNDNTEGTMFDAESVTRHRCLGRDICVKLQLPGGRGSMRLINVTQRPGPICRNIRIYKSGVLLRPPVVIYVAHF